MWLANRLFPSVRRLLRENDSLKAQLSRATKEPNCSDEEALADLSKFMRGFSQRLANRPPGNLLNIGARNRTGGNIHRWIPEGWTYHGVDIASDKDVTLVTDAHELSLHLPHSSFDAVVSHATFEHLLIPWKVVIEINRVCRVGALVMVTSHQCYPLHDEPTDYFRFSAQAWDALFNRHTGFRILEQKMGTPARFP